MAVMHLAGAAILWFVPQALVAQNGALLIGLLFGYTLCYMPTLALTNNIAFHSLSDKDKTFPVVRVFGTIGWIVAGIFIGVTGISDTTGIFTLAAIISVILALYSLTLPNTPAPAKGLPVKVRDLFCADAFALLKVRHFLFSHSARRSSLCRWEPITHIPRRFLLMRALATSVRRCHLVRCLKFSSCW